jgi:L-asparaginase II
LQDDVIRALPGDEPLAALWRGSLIESVHRGRAVFCDPAGEVLDAVGDPEGYTYVRSSAKPFQALPLILSGAADAFGLTDEEITIVCASHSGEDQHLAAVRSVLEKAGLSEDALQSGPHPPFHAPAAGRLARSGEEPRPIHGNCSGKHAGMLAVCAHESWNLRDYRDPGHPLQQTILKTVAEVCALEPDEVLLGGDGCGVPAFAMPLSSLATGFARLITGEHLPDGLAEGCRRIREAMRAHPYTVAGTDRFDTQLMQDTALLAKGGAEGVFACGSDGAWGMAVKISDGAGRAVRPVVLSMLSRRGVALSRDLEPDAVRDLHGEAVGTVEPLI